MKCKLIFHEDGLGGQKDGPLFETKGFIMYILAATGGPTFIVHTIIAAGTIVAGATVALIRKLRRA